MYPGLSGPIMCVFPNITVLGIDVDLGVSGPVEHLGAVRALDIPHSLSSVQSFQSLGVALTFLLSPRPGFYLPNLKPFQYHQSYHFLSKDKMQESLLIQL